MLLRIGLFVFTGAIAFIFAGCADVHVQRVTHDDYETEGIRYYRPRPYVAVSTPFAVGGEDFYVTATVSPDGSVLKIDANHIPQRLKNSGAFATDASSQKLNVPFDMVNMGAGMRRQLGFREQSDSSTPGGTQGGTKEEKQGETQKEKQDETQKEKQGETNPSTKPTEKKSDVQEKKNPDPLENITKATFSAGGNEHTDIVEKVNGHFDIVMLPDFTEQYAVRVTAGIGAASADVGLENGWLLENAKVAIDNRELGKFILRNVEKFVDIAADAARVAISPTMALAGSGDGGEVAPQSLANRTVLVRVRYVIEAQPGLYPILKPWENPNYEITRFRSQPSGIVAKSRLKAWDDSTSKPVSQKNVAEFVHLPYRPYTVLAFNVRRSVVFEAVNISEKPDASNQILKDDHTKLRTELKTDRTYESFTLVNNLKTDIKFSVTLDEEYDSLIVLAELAAAGPDGAVTKDYGEEEIRLLIDKKIEALKSEKGINSPHVLRIKNWGAVKEKYKKP